MLPLCSFSFSFVHHTLLILSTIRFNSSFSLLSSTRKGEEEGVLNNSDNQIK
jgi:hypothetical protein